VLRWWDWIEETLVGILGLVALVIALLQVIGRYIDPQHAISYAEEVIVYLVIWAIMIVSSQLVRRDGHVRPDLILRLLSPQALRWVEMFNCLVAIVFLRRPRLVRLGDCRHLAADRRDQLDRPAISRLGSTTLPAGRQRADC